MTKEKRDVMDVVAMLFFGVPILWCIAELVNCLTG